MMKRMLTVCIVLAWVLPHPGLAQPISPVPEAAQDAFARLPVIETVPRIAGVCGADTRVHPVVAYCTTGNRILMVEGAAEPAVRDYLLAHAYGHGVQVQHGVADVALAEITRRPEDEMRLRGYVERQVDCIAGFILARAGVPLPDLTALFTTDPLDRPHWGRSPLRAGPHLPVPVAERAAWLATGYRQGLGACAVGEFSADLLLQALNR